MDNFFSTACFYIQKFIYGMGTPVQYVLKLRRPMYVYHIPDTAYQDASQCYTELQCLGNLFEQSEHANHSNGWRPTLTNFSLSAVCDDILGWMPRDGRRWSESRNAV